MRRLAGTFTVASGTPPHGDSGAAVQTRNSVAVVARIAAQGGPVSRGLRPGVGQIGITATFAPLFRDRAPALGGAIRFVADPKIPVSMQAGAS